MMGATIAIGLLTDDPAAAERVLIDAAETFCYGIVHGVDLAEEDARSGLQELATSLNWNVVCLLKTPATNPAPLAYEIEVDLRGWETKNTRPKFFDFMLLVSIGLRRLCSEHCIVFAGEWRAGDKVRVYSGPPEDIVSFLKRPGNWNQRLLVPKTGRYQDSDEVPLLLRVNL